MASITPQTSLKERLVGKTLHEVPTPSIVLDLAKLEENCQRMMDTAAKNGIGWRAHIKTHKASLVPDGQVSWIEELMIIPDYRAHEASSWRGSHYSSQHHRLHRARGGKSHPLTTRIPEQRPQSQHTLRLPPLPIRHPPPRHHFHHPRP